MAVYQDSQKTPKPDAPRITAKPSAQPAKPKRRTPAPAPKPLYTDWAMF